METLAKIKAAIKGKKTYILGSVAIATAAVAWASGEISGVACATAIFVAFEGMFLRAGVAKTTQEWTE